MDPAGANRSFWMEGAALPTYPVLSDDTSADVAVVGGGITGLTAALRLCQAGRSVCLIEMNRIGSGTTGSSTGHLDGYTDQTIGGLIRAFGEEKARIALHAKRSAIDHIERWDRELNLQCQFRRIPAYLYCEEEADVETLKNEYANARQLGLTVDMQRHAPLPFGTALALMFPDQGRFDPLAYVKGLARAVAEASGRIFENTRAEKIWEEGGKARIETNHGTITANDLILAGHAPLLGTFTVEPRAMPYQSYVLGVRVLNDIPDALYWDTARPYHYTRRATDADPRLLIVGGADHHTGVQIDTAERFRELERHFRHRLRVESASYRWSHEFFETADGAPYIGRVPGYEHVYMGAAYSGDGLTFGTVAGIVNSDLILGRENAAAAVFDPGRIKPLSTVRRLTGNLLHMAKHFVGDRLMGADFDSVDEIAPGQGGLVTVEGERLAVYRDEHGGVHMLSPVCRHMGCYVHWNSAEKTWDCPCHGGRYDAYGNVIMGPPKHSLHERTPVAAESR
jgi:glycine/D-amino acid oxidase-like deaminating enzyme/nitrite reductase/ring-hydroxylating ferredoxin subunit